MANPHRGEICLRIDGRTETLRLTLGALAELETRLEVASLVGLAERFESGQVTTRDLIAVLAAGLKGAGATIDERALCNAEIEGGAVGAMDAALRLLARTFRADQSAL